MNKHEAHSDRLNAEERRELKDSDFGIPESREFPMPDAAHGTGSGIVFPLCPGR